LAVSPFEKGVLLFKFGKKLFVFVEIPLFAVVFEVVNGYFKEFIINKAAMPYLFVEEISLLFIGVKAKAINVEHCRLFLKLIYQIFLKKNYVVVAVIDHSSC
jgi:hypothetical protein